MDLRSALKTVKSIDLTVEDFVGVLTALLPNKELYCSYFFALEAKLLENRVASSEF